jgi:hypothetical protein
VCVCVSVRVCVFFVELCECNRFELFMKRIEGGGCL